MAVIAAMGTTGLTVPQGACSGTCGQCSACGLAAIPVALWLAEKRWKLSSKIRLLLSHPIARIRRMRAVGYFSKEKVT